MHRPEACQLKGPGVLLWRVSPCTVPDLDSCSDKLLLLAVYYHCTSLNIYQGGVGCVCVCGGGGGRFLHTWSTGGECGLHSRSDSHLSEKKREGPQAKVVRFSWRLILAEACLLCFQVWCLAIGFIGVSSPLFKLGSLSCLVCCFSFNFQFCCFCAGLPWGKGTRTKNSFEVWRVQEVHTNL